MERGVAARESIRLEEGIQVLRLNWKSCAWRGNASLNAEHRTVWTAPKAFLMEDGRLGTRFSNRPWFRKRPILNHCDLQTD